MMNPVTLGCPRCAAPVGIEPHDSQLVCARCGEALLVERAGESVTLRRIVAPSANPELARLEEELKEINQPRAADPPRRYPAWRRWIDLLSALSAIVAALSGHPWFALLLSFAWAAEYLYVLIRSEREQRRRIEEELKSLDRIISELRKATGALDPGLAAFDDFPAATGEEAPPPKEHRTLPPD